ncbi:MAG: hypothetical protein M0Z58_03045 [Nitrospiraceae bacterium]|nr:hypothetical protein [Nitrospiraceae bacterium]
MVFFIFKRPDVTEKVFAEIAGAKPPKLFVVADGPGKDRPGEAKACAAARAIIDRVDWDCEVRTNYSDINMGGPRRIPNGMDWVFDSVEEAIILEDDCLPHPSFFRFCEELLQRYRDDERIAVISGNNFQFGRKRTAYSYYFSRYNHIWGWATWRRAWKNYDAGMTTWPKIRDGKWLRDFLGNKRAARYWSGMFNALYEGKKDHWDFRWTFACWRHRALTVLPNVNLVSNIGWGKEAQSAKDPKNILAAMRTGPMEFPLSHPPFLLRDSAADNFTERNIFSRSCAWELKGILYDYLTKIRPVIR